jgi:photosystem II stability/assembly factor-like uncharacterized protein
MATRTKKHRRVQKRQQIQQPKRAVQETQGLLAGRRGWLIAGASLAVGAAALAAVIYIGVSGDGTAAGEQPVGQVEPQAQPPGLPDTPDYHSLLVAPRDSDVLVLGTHQGLHRSSDGGRSWTAASLDGQDAMNLARTTRDVVWAGGHEVLAKSEDGGETWEDVRPEGLPGLDVHGFAVDPGDPKTLWAAIAGQGLYRSSDGGRSFSLVSREVGPGVMALGVTPDGRILAGDMEQGVMVSANDGKSWTRVHEAGLMGLAINPKDPRSILATGPGILLSRDGGRTWEEALPLPDGAGPVAWAPSAPQTAYVVGFDKTLYKTEDGGATWRPVA